MHIIIGGTSAATTVRSRKIEFAIDIIIWYVQLYNPGGGSSMVVTWTAE